jgi:hypothetical protein
METAKIPDKGPALKVNHHFLQGIITAPHTFINTVFLHIGQYLLIR